MARGRLSYENELRLLIKCITGFDEEEENFSVCLDYAVSNLKYHRLLDPDSHKIHKSVNGLVEKFQIHSQNEKAEVLKTLVTKFLETPAFEDRDHGMTNTHYAVLSLLLNLSYSPLYVNYIEPAITAPSGEQDTFDWKSYLLEDIDVYTQFSDDSSVDSFEDEDEAEAEGAKSKLTFAEETKDDELGLIPNVSFHSVTFVNDLEKKAHDWLKSNLVIQYWSKSESTSHELRSSPSQFFLDWEVYQSRINLSVTGKHKLLMTEHHIIRETIWLLMGVPSSVVYVWDGTKYAPNELISVAHLTQEALASLLDNFSYYGTVVRRLYQLVSDVSRAPVIGSQGNNVNYLSTNCQTYQAFTAALSAYLQQVEDELVTLEKRVCLQEESHTLARLCTELRPRLAELETLDIVYTKGIAALSNVTSPSQKASGLLNAIFEALMVYDSMGKYNQKQVSFLLTLWIKSSKPYLDIIDDWTAKGDLVDPYKEFIIQRNVDIRSLDENFWDTAFTLHCMETSGEEDNSCPSSKNSYITPRFLVPVLNQIILAGKSMELIQNLGTLSQVTKGSKKKNLYAIFIESVEAEVGSLTDAASREQKVSGQELIAVQKEVSPATTIFLENVSKQLQLPGISDPLLNIYFGKILTCKPTPGHVTDSKLDQMKFDTLTPIQLLLDKCLYPHICDYSTSLLEILKQDYHLNQYFTAIRSYFLMEAGDVMFDFYSHLFDRLRLNEPWQDVSLLNGVLQEALQRRYPNDTDNVYVTIESKKNTKAKKQPLTALEGLTLHYKVPWPVNIVINSRCLQAYNQVFGFLLQIKRVKYSLDELRFTDLEKENFVKSSEPQESILENVEESAERRLALIHRIHITRMKLLHFVNNLHNYIMTRILHSTGIEFESMLSGAKDLDAVIRAHNLYLSKVHERCLLHKKTTLIKQVIAKVLEISLSLAAKWQNGINSFSDKLLADLEKEFSDCIRFLSTFLNNFVKRGSFPHLESLAFALVTSSEACPLKKRDE